MPAQPYKPDPLADTGQHETPFGVKGAPTQGSLGSVPATLLRLAMRRLPAMGYGATGKTSGVKPSSNALTAGSHGKIV